jgi:Transcriptional regulator containing an amidase domain and an AraC-type DNA-binding HTH domain
MENNSSLFVSRQRIVKSRYPVIIVLADSLNVRNNLKVFLEANYMVIWASNVMHALQITKENSIDLIIIGKSKYSEEGFTLSRILKNNEQTNHIGVIMLLVDNNAESHIKCYNSNVDVLLSFPVEDRVLNAAIKNLIRKDKSRCKSKSQRIGLDSNKTHSFNGAFIQKCIEVVESRLSDSSFNENQFASSMCVSRSTLYRRLKSHFGISSKEFVRTMRLNCAAKLLMNQSIMVSDIAYSVGFSDPKYFSFSFKTMYGLTPLKYRKSFNNGI